ncbi:MAG: hypothetical protein ABIP94_13020 [Planctomycetota bacterium]
MRWFAFALVLSAAACACGAKTMETLPDWSGPPLQVKSLADGGLELELMAPTAGHTFELGHVEIVGERASVQLVHGTPGAAFVAQVLTPLRVTVPAGRLAAARRVSVHVATRNGAGEDPHPTSKLAFTFVR